MTTSEKNLENDRSFREHEVRNLEDRAKAAEERYSHEVVSHADSIKLVEQLRRDLSAAQAKVRECQTASDTAISKLTASEQSWSQQKDTLQREISDLKSRCDDLSSQNSTLHKHLESVSSQAARITQAAMDPSGSPSGEDDTSEDTETKLAELRKVISWLRNEKDIADKKDVVSQGEVARLKAHIERLSHSLEEARTTISEVCKSVVDSVRHTYSPFRNANVRSKALLPLLNMPNFSRELTSSTSFVTVTLIFVLNAKYTRRRLGNLKQN
ncbi:hypothetical protein FA15DRAFT_384127 [Coprinopsis marcescibilis]|uniref:Nucleoprotein TPR/MLP1-2 domain-containing protein n=1 Tax=Coprinopsis marcescibilis TaxID=230819 RepID=A0A5C3KWS0_COPMA|nr:hypothetical protein FA15DRAFT_384127 [Coprinopsis marcescibilis]